MIRPFRFPFALSFVLLASGFLELVHGAVTGFGDNGAGWTGNNAGGTPPVFSADRLTIIQNGEQDTAKSAWFQTPQSITGGFSARFTLRRANTGGPFAREGAAFVIQSSAAGTAALGGSGAGLGYAAQGATPGIGSSIGFGFRAVATAGGSLSQFSFGSNGGFGGATSTSPVDLTLVDVPVQVGIAYDAATGVVRVTLIQNGAVFSASTQSVTFTGSQFVGTILAQASITVTTGTSVRGRALARTGAVTLDSNDFSPASCPPPVGSTPTPTVVAGGGGNTPRATTTTVAGIPATGSAQGSTLLVAALLLSIGVGAAIVSRRRPLRIG